MSSSSLMAWAHSCSFQSTVCKKGNVVKKTTRRYVSVVSATKASNGSRTHKSVRNSVVTFEKKTWKNVVVAERRRYVGE